MAKHNLHALRLACISTRSTASWWSPSTMPSIWHRAQTVPLAIHTSKCSFFPIEGMPKSFTNFVNNFLIDFPVRKASEKARHLRAPAAPIGSKHSSIRDFGNVIWLEGFWRSPYGTMIAMRRTSSSGRCCWTLLLPRWTTSPDGTCSPIWTTTRPSEQ